MDDINLVNDDLYTYALVMKGIGSGFQDTPCQKSSLNLGGNFTVRLGEVGEYSVHVCVWNASSLVCNEPLQLTYTTTEPSFVGEGQVMLTSTDFLTPDITSDRFHGWNYQQNNPFKMGAWALNVDQYNITTTGYGCMDFLQAKLVYTATMNVHRPSVSFIKEKGACPPVSYSAEDNTVGLVDKNPIFPEKNGYSIAYSVLQPSYGAQYGFLKIVRSPGSISLYTHVNNEDVEHEVLLLTAGSAEGENKKGKNGSVITHQEKAHADETLSLLYTDTYALFTAPYFYEACKGDLKNFQPVTRYESYGSVVSHYLMMKPEPQEGKESYWIPLKRSGIYVDYAAQCQEPPCGTGTGTKASPYGRPWILRGSHVDGPSDLEANIPSWTTLLSDAYQTVSMTDFNEMDYWLSCPSSSYPFKELDSSAPTFHTEEL